MSTPCWWQLKTPPCSHMPPASPSPHVQLRKLHVALGPQPTSSTRLWRETRLPGNYSWSDHGVSVPEEILGFPFFSKITGKWSVETWHCHVIQMLGLEPDRGYRTLTPRIILFFSVLERLAWIIPSLSKHLDSFCLGRNALVGTCLHGSGKNVQLKFCRGCTCFSKANSWLSGHA